MNKDVWSAIGAVMAMAAFSNAAYAQDAQQEVDKQVAKLIGDAVSSRVTQSLLGPTADKNSAWLSGTHLRIKVSAAGMSNSGSTELYIVGYDREFTPNLIGGAALSYADAPRGFGISGHNWSLAPYLAYRFTQYLFAIGKLTYSESRGSVAGGTTKSEAWSGDVSLNGLYKFQNNVLVKGRVGIGDSESESRSNFGGTTMKTRTSTVQGVADAELGYFFMPDLYGFVGGQATSTDDSNSYAAYARVGIEKQFDKRVTASLKYEEKVDDNLPSGVKLTLRNITLAVRIPF